MNLDKLNKIVINPIPLEDEDGCFYPTSFWEEGKYLTSNAKILYFHLCMKNITLEHALHMVTHGNVKLFIKSMKELQYFGWIKKSRGKKIRVIYSQVSNSTIPKGIYKHFRKYILPTYELTAVNEKDIYAAAETLNYNEVDRRKMCDWLFGKI